MSLSAAVHTRKAASVDAAEARYKGFAPGTQVLKKGTTYQSGALPLPCDIVRDRDVALTLRDGVVLYADVFRPNNAARVPAIVNWSPYGKGDTGFWTLDNSAMFPNRFGIKRAVLSGLQVWEGNDPAYWCAHGYAVVQVDARGTFDSQGDISYMGSQEARDEHDAIEALAALPWSSGKVGLAGNSWLAMSQWRTAAERPPHLAAIAPWEGLIDLYRDALSRGGVPRTAFPAFVRDKMYGRGAVEDPIAMLGDHPLIDAYWDDKVPDVARIAVPAYVVGSYANPVHVAGTLRAWGQLTSNKWLRIHNTHEWPDFYEPANVEDLRRFFDRFLRGIDNGWEQTPAVRMAVLDPGHDDVVNRAETTFPPARTKPTELLLDAGLHTLQKQAPAKEATTSYALTDRSPQVDFLYRFTENTEIIGAPMLRLWVSAEGHDDADLFVYLQKLSESGAQLWHQAVTLGVPFARTLMPLAHRLGVKPVALAFYGGPDGVLRVSRRGIERSGAAGAELALRQEQKLKPSEVVEAEIPFLPTAMRFHAGEQLRLRISGRNLLPPLLPGLAEQPLQPGTRHVFHTGGSTPSCLHLPTTAF